MYLHSCHRNYPKAKSFETHLNSRFSFFLVWFVVFKTFIDTFCSREFSVTSLIQCLFSTDCPIKGENLDERAPRTQCWLPQLKQTGQTWCWCTLNDVFPQSSNTHSTTATPSCCRRQRINLKLLCAIFEMTSFQNHLCFDTTGAGMQGINP